jgi:hypothetical protein
MTKVSHISGVPQPRTAQDIVNFLEVKDGEDYDDYHRSILNGAMTLVANKKGHYRYLGQYRGLRCLWESEPCSEATDSTRVTVVTMFVGTILPE